METISPAEKLRKRDMDEAKTRLLIHIDDMSERLRQLKGQLKDGKLSGYLVAVAISSMASMPALMVLESMSLFNCQSRQYE